jgi:hypothetical protein
MGAGPREGGGCLCGRVRFELTATPIDVHHCHCSICRRATGAALATLVWLSRDAVRWTGSPLTLFRSSPIAVLGFCHVCGTSLTLRYCEEERFAIMIGAFDNPETFVPTHHYGTEGRIPWADIAPSLPGEATEPKFSDATAFRDGSAR